MEYVRIKYHSDIDKIKHITKGDWVDLRTAEDVELTAGEFGLISLGVSVQLPLGYEALIVPRSSTFIKYGIIQTNCVGVIDESYNGDNDIWKFPAYATRNVVIPKNTRICQFRLFKHQPVIKFTETEELGNQDRGGFGSTGEV